MIHHMRPEGHRITTGLEAFVATLPAECRMVEVGCYSGEATRLFLQRVAHVTAVDRWQDYTEDNRPSGALVVLDDMAAVEQAFDQVVAECPERVTKVKGASADVAATFPDRTVDLVYLDASHKYRDVLDDLVAWLPKIKPGGLIAGHDYDGDHMEVRRAVEHHFGESPHVVFPDSTWVRRVKSDRPVDGPGLVRLAGPPTPTVLIGIPCQMAGGFRPFEMALTQLMEGRAHTQVFYSMTGVLPAARNRIVRRAYQVGAEYIWFLDDDQPFFPGDPSRLSDLDALLAHRLDAVIPLSPRRGAPFLPLLFDVLHEDGWIASQHYLLAEDHGLIPIAAAGFAGLLIKTAVFTKMGSDGWFEFGHPPDDWDSYSEDFPFYRKLQQTGVQLYCDLEVRFGHAVQCVAWVVRQNGQWMTALADHEPFVMFPQPMHPLGLDHVQRMRLAQKKLVLA